MKAQKKCVDECLSNQSSSRPGAKKNQNKPKVAASSSALSCPSKLDKIEPQLFDSKCKMFTKVWPDYKPPSEPFQQVSDTLNQPQNQFKPNVWIDQQNSSNPDIVKAKIAKVSNLLNGSPNTAKPKQSSSLKVISRPPSQQKRLQPVKKTTKRNFNVQAPFSYRTLHSSKKTPPRDDILSTELAPNRVHFVQNFEVQPEKLLWPSSTSRNSTVKLNNSGCSKRFVCLLNFVFFVSLDCASVLFLNRSY